MTQRGAQRHEDLGQCEAVKVSGNRCTRSGTYMANGRKTCARHLQHMIAKHAMTDSTGHLWTTVYLGRADA